MQLPHFLFAIVYTHLTLTGRLVVGYSPQVSSQNVVQPKSQAHLKALTTPPLGAKDWYHEFSPDGRTLFFGRTAQTDDKADLAQIWRLDLKTKKMQRLPIIGIAPRVSPKGKLIAFEAYNEMGQSIGIGLYALPNGPLRLLGKSGESIHWSPDGTSITYFGYSPAAIRLLRLPTNQERNLPFIPSAKGAVWSPNGKFIALAVERSAISPSSRATKRNLIISKTDGVKILELARPTIRLSSSNSLSWSSDSHTVYFSGQNNNEEGAYIFALHIPTRKVNRLSKGPYDVNPVCSPNNKWLAYKRIIPRGKNRYSIIFCQPNGLAARVVEVPSISDMVWSPDSSFIVAGSDNGAIWKVPAPAK